MTPAEAAVLSDLLRSVSIGGKPLDEPTIARMVRAMDPNYTRDLCLGVGMAVRSRAVDIARQTRAWADVESIDRIDVAEQTDFRLHMESALSPAEPPAANQTRDDGASEGT